MCPRRRKVAESRDKTEPTASPWYKDAIIYELHVRSFFDSNGDGIVDFLGLTEKLDYLQDLGVTAVWLLPYYPSRSRTVATISPTSRGCTPTTAPSGISKPRGASAWVESHHRAGAQPHV